MNNKKPNHFHKHYGIKSLGILLLFCNLFSSCNGQTKDKTIKEEKATFIENEKFLLPYRVGEKWGLADTLGNLRIPAKYDSVSDFRINYLYDDNRKITGIYSYYFVKENGKIKIIDPSGEQILQEYEPMFRKGYDFTYTKNGKYGKLQIQYREESLKVIEEIPFIYDTIYKMGFSSFVVELDSKKGLFKNNKLFIPIEYDSIAYEFNYLDENKDSHQEKWFGYKKVLNEKMTNVVFYGNKIVPPVGITVVEKPLQPEKMKITPSDIKRLIGLEKYDNYTIYEAGVGQLNVVQNHDGKKYALVGRNPKPDFELKFEYDSIYRVHYTKSFNDYQKLLVTRKNNKYYVWADGFTPDLKPAGEYDAVEQRIGKYIKGKEFPFVIFKKNGKYGADMFFYNRKGVINYIPFEFDDIIDDLFVVKNGKYGVYQLTEDKNYIKIEPKYREKPVLYRDNKQKVILYECVTDEGEKILVYRNGLELYRKN